MHSKDRQIQRRPVLVTEMPLMLFSMLLARSPLVEASRVMIRVLRILWRNRAVQAEHATTPAGPLPSGPFEVKRRRQLGDLLIWVPRRIDSFLIDDLTGGYGYSHTTVDTGEIDVPTGKPVMAEITVGQTVTRKFQDQYGGREFVRLPLARAGVKVEKFVECVKSKMGERYDTWDAITLGAVQDPAREVCSGLVADCLPEGTLRKIAWARRMGMLPKHAVSVHSKLQAFTTKAFVSPNGFAMYYGVPKGHKIRKPNTLISPKPVGMSVGRIAGAAARRHGWKAGLALLAVGAIGVALLQIGRGARYRGIQLKG